MLSWNFREKGSEFFMLFLIVIQRNTSLSNSSGNMLCCQLLNILCIWSLFFWFCRTGMRSYVCCWEILLMWMESSRRALQIQNRRLVWLSLKLRLCMERLISLRYLDTTPMLPSGWTGSKPLVTQRYGWNNCPIKSTLHWSYVENE